MISSQISGGRNLGVEHLKAGDFWDRIEHKLMKKDPNNCLMKRGPNSVHDLLSRIFKTAPKNSLSVAEIANHPWLQGPVPSTEEMEKELKKRFKVCISVCMCMPADWSIVPLRYINEVENRDRASLDSSRT